MKRRYLGTRLMLMMLALVVFIIVFVGVTLFTTIIGNYNREFYDDMALLRSRVDFFALEEQDKLINYISSQEVVNPLLTDRNYYLLRGETVVYGNADGGIIQKTDNLKRVLAGGEHQNGTPFTQVLDYAWHYSGDLTIYIVDHRTDLNASMEGYILIFVQSFALAIGLAVVLSFLFARGFLIPIHKLTKSADKMRQGEFIPIESHSRDEVGILTNTFNEMGLRITKNIELLKELLRNIPKPVFAVDREGVVFHSNEACDGLFEQGLSAEEISRHGEPRFMLRLGERFYCIYRSLFLLEDGTEGTIFLLDDITEAELLEKQRKQFVADVSHELKTPLTIMKSYSETLLEQQLDPATTERFLQVINRSADQMNGMVNQLLALIRAEEDLGERKEAVDLVSAAGEVLEAMQLESKKKELCLLLNAPPERVLICDGDRIRRVMINLLSNSIKYSNPGGKIIVTIEEAAGGVIFAVADEGIGIEKKHLPHLFEKFYRVDKARSRETGGTGLGLSIVRSIVSGMGGEVQVESTLGKGSVFTCFFPD